MILNCSSCQKNATDEGAIALKALDFQINVKNCISYFNIGGQKRKSVEYHKKKVHQQVSYVWPASDARKRQNQLTPPYFD